MADDVIRENEDPEGSVLLPSFGPLLVITNSLFQQPGPDPSREATLSYFCFFVFLGLIQLQLQLLSHLSFYFKILNLILTKLPVFNDTLM